MRSSLFAALTVAVVGMVPLLASAQDKTVEARHALQSARELYAAGNWDTAKEAYADALAKAPDDSVVEAEALLEMSSLLWEQGDYDAAAREVKKALALAKKLSLDHAVGRLMLTLGHIEASRGSFSDAESTLRICVKSAGEQRDDNFEALCRMNLRFVRQIQGKSPGSESQYRRDLATLEKSGEAVLVGTALAKSAELQEKTGDFEGALKTLEAAQKHFEQAQSVPSQARNRLRLAQVHQNLGRWDDAGKELEGLIVTFKNMSNRPSLVTAYALRGKQRSHEGQNAKALADLDASLSLAKKVGSPQLVANSHLALCEHYARTNILADAYEHCDAAALKFRKIGALTLASRAQIFAARVAHAKEQWLAARDRYVEAIQTLEKDVSPTARDPRELAVQKVNLCQVEVQLSSTGAHLRCLEAKEALDAVKASDEVYRGMVAATDYGIGVSTPPKDAEDARKALEAAANEWKRLGIEGRRAQALLRLGKLQADDAKLASKSTRTFETALRSAGEPSPETRPLIIQIRIQLAQRQLAEKDYYTAKMNLAELVSAAGVQNDHYSAAWAYNALGSAQLKTGERDAAIEALEKALPLARKARDTDLAESIERNIKKLKEEK